MKDTYMESRTGWRVDGHSVRLITSKKRRYTDSAQDRRDREAEKLEVRLARATKWAQAEGIAEGLTLTLEKGFNAVGIAPGLNPFRSAGIDVDPRIVVAAMQATVHASRLLRNKYLGAGFAEVKDEIKLLLSPYVDGTPDHGKLLRRQHRRRR